MRIRWWRRGLQLPGNHGVLDLGNDEFALPGHLRFHLQNVALLAPANVARPLGGEAPRGRGVTP
jgi:hypothetical protein